MAGRVKSLGSQNFRHFSVEVLGSATWDSWSEVFPPNWEEPKPFSNFHSFFSVRFLRCERRLSFGLP